MVRFDAVMMRVALAAMISVGSASSASGSGFSDLPAAKAASDSILSHGERKLEEYELRSNAQPLFQSFASRRGNERSERRLASGGNTNRVSCDAAFLKCARDDVCRSCFKELGGEEIDWASIPPGTTCDEAMDALHKSQLCSRVTKDLPENLFCETFRSCAVTNDPHNDEYNNNGADEGDSDEIRPPLNCANLTKCEWDGMHPGFIGDGICHDNIYGCYNTEICGYDGGDCCQDTCENKQKDVEKSVAECGHDGYSCRDPKSENCNTKLSTRCPSHLVPDHQNENKLPYGGKPCGPGQAQYRVMMYDAFGDGWDDTTKLIITPSDNEYERVFEGTLKNGSKGLEYVCLSREPTCYRVIASGGIWGAEDTWDVRPLSDGMPTLAEGGAPMRCSFGVSGGDCEKTCNGRTGEKPPVEDPQYKNFKSMVNCMEKKCVIQLSQCQKDGRCAACFTDEPPSYCLQLEHFNAVVDCAMCGCTERASSQFCKTGATPGRIEPRPPPTPNEEGQVIKQCTGAETMQGSQAVMDFHDCTEFDSIGMMVTKFNNSNFGMLDKFETCAHAYANGTVANHYNGYTALGCMRILKDAITNPLTGDPDAPREAISALAKKVYEDPANFCECATKASNDCPQCPSFEQFKTLLFESMDACRALDEIDCDAWKEFAPSCKTQLTAKFQQVNFKNKDQCTYVQDGCGAVGTFPAFRRLDCGANNEVPKEDWDMYTDYSKNCLTDQPPIPGPQPTPVAPPVSPPVAPPTDNTLPTAPVPAPTSKPYVAPTQKPYNPPDQPTKPYHPPDDDSGSSSNKSDVEPKKKKSHFWKWFFFLCILGAGGYWYYKRRSDAFSFGQYRRAYQFDDGGSEMMYGNLNSSTSFEPPSLPPPPQSMGSMVGSMMSNFGMGNNNNNYGGGGGGFGYSNMQSQGGGDGGYTGPGMT